MKNYSMNPKLIAFILLLVVIGVVIILLVNTEGDKKTNSTVTATDVINDNLTDPVIVSRAYFTETLEGPTGDFTGYASSWPENDRLHRFSHKKS